LDLEELSIKDFVCINLDLILYKDDDLLNKAFELLIRFHTQQQTILSLINQVQLLEQGDAYHLLKTAEDKATQLRKLGEASEFWLGSIEKHAVIQAKTVVDILDYFVQECTLKSSDPFVEQQSAELLGSDLLLVNKRQKVQGASSQMRNRVEPEQEDVLDN